MFTQKFAEEEYRKPFVCIGDAEQRAVGGLGHGEASQPLTQLNSGTTLI